MKGKYKDKSQKTKKMAAEHIADLFLKADEIFHTNKEKANQFIKKARRIGMKVKYRLPSTIQKRFCKFCYSFLVPGVNLRVRTRNSHLVYYCLECKRTMRFPYKK